MDDAHLGKLEGYFLLDNSCEVGLELIAEVRRLQAALAAERERCARIAESVEDAGGYVQAADGGSVWESDAGATRAEIARRIRAG